MLDAKLAGSCRQVLPSVHRMVASGRMGFRAAPMSVPEVDGRMRLAVAPPRSPAMSIGTCSLEGPRLLALPPRRRVLRPNHRCPLAERRK